MPLGPREQRDPETVAWAADWNRENVRWTGSVPIQVGEPVLLRFAAVSPAAASGEVRISYEWKRGLGGGSSAATVTLNEAESTARDASSESQDGGS